MQALAVEVRPPNTKPNRPGAERLDNVYRAHASAVERRGHGDMPSYASERLVQSSSRANRSERCEDRTIENMGGNSYHTHAWLPTNDDSRLSCACIVSVYAGFHLCGIDALSGCFRSSLLRLSFVLFKKGPEGASTNPRQRVSWVAR